MIEAKPRKSLSPNGPNPLVHYRVTEAPSIVYDLILTDLVNISSEKEAPSVKYDKIEHKIIELSDRLCNIFDNIIRELMKGKLYGIREQ